MKKKIDIAEILKNAPKGLELYSPLFGYVKLWKSNRIPTMVELGNDFPIRVETSSSTVDFDKYGRPAMYRSSECECMIFPSKENRDWSTFKAPWCHKTFKSFQKVLVNYYNIWRLSFYAFYENGHKVTPTFITVLKDKDIIPYEGNEELLGKEVRPNNT